MTRVTVLRGPRVFGWPDRIEGRASARDRTYVVPLGHALERSYTSDAHFVQYECPSDPRSPIWPRRLCVDVFDRGLEVAMSCIVFDVDDPEMHGSKLPARDAWRAELRANMAKLHDAHPGPFYYETRGGARVVYTLPEPTILRTSADGKRWSEDYAIAAAYLERVFGIEVDRACADWTRLFRLPHATREPNGKPEDRLVIGDPHNIGALQIKASPADMERARKVSKAFREAREIDFTPCTGDGQGLLFHLLRAQGFLMRARGSDGYVIRCPNESKHTGGKRGDGSTLLYMPARGHEIGAIDCKHAHCQSLRFTDWLGFFDESDLDAARKAAGIVRKRAAAR